MLRFGSAMFSNLSEKVNLFLSILNDWLVPRKEAILFISSLIGLFAGINEYRDKQNEKIVKETLAIISEHREKYKTERNISNSFSLNVTNKIKEICNNSKEKSVCIDSKDKFNIGIEVFYLVHLNSGELNDLKMENNHTQESISNAIRVRGNFYNDISNCVNSNLCSAELVCKTLSVEIHNYYILYRGYFYMYREYYGDLYINNIHSLLSTCPQTSEIMLRTPVHGFEII